MIGPVGLFERGLSAGSLAGPGGGVSLGPAAEANAGISFAELLSSAANRTVDTLQHAEQVSVKALQGEADTREVVDAVMSAEQSLQAAVAIRDKIIAAYMEISRMAI